MTVDESRFIGQPIGEVPRQEPGVECMGKKKQKRDGDVVRDEEGNALFGGYCQLTAGWGTDHVGEGRCKLHAGASLTGEDNPAFEHGLFSDHLGPEDRRTIEILKTHDDAEKLDELINWRLARLRRYLRQKNDVDETSFFEKFDSMVREGRKNGEPGLSAAQIRELARALDKNNRAAQSEIDLVRRLIKTRNKIAEGEDVNVTWREALADVAGGDSE